MPPKGSKKAPAATASAPAAKTSPVAKGGATAGGGGAAKKKKANGASSPRDRGRQLGLFESFARPPKKLKTRAGGADADAPLTVRVVPHVYDAFTVKFLETEGAERGFKSRNLSDEGEDDARRSEFEFVNAFDALLRNARDQIPPQYFYERLARVLMRRRLAPTRRRRARAEADDAEEDESIEAFEFRARVARSEDAKLARATIDVFKRVHALHPAAEIVMTTRSNPIDSTPRGGTDADGPGTTPAVATCELTWTPIDSEARARDHHSDRTPKKGHAGAGGAGSERGIAADWRRFAALMAAAAGKPETLWRLCDASEESERRGDGGGAARRRGRAGHAGAARGAIDGSEDEEDEGDEDAPPSQAQARARERAKKRERAARAVAPPLGATLFFLHAVDVFAADANARLAVFNARTSGVSSASENTETTTLDAAAETETPPPADGASQPTSDGVPETPATPARVAAGAWATGLLRDSLLYRFIADHVPTDGERAAFLVELLELAASGVGGGDGDGETPPAPLANGAEDAGARDVAAAAHVLLAYVDELLDALERAGASTAGGTTDRRLVAIRTQLDDACKRCYMKTRGLKDAASKRAFLAAMPGSATRKLRLARSVLRETVIARQAPGVMRPGIGSRADASGAIDVFEYASSDPKTAIKSQKESDGSADYADAVGRVGAIIGACAQAANEIVGGGGGVDGDGHRAPPPHAASLRAAAKAFAREATGGGGGELRARDAAVVDVAVGSVGGAA
jgi:hypothetical protein